MKKDYRKLIAAATVATLVVPATVTANSNFKDIKESAYYAEAVLNLAERGIINGYQDDQTFRPNENVTRGQAAKIIAGVLKLDTKNVENPDFKDVPTNHQFYGAIAALANAGIINGYQDTQTFKPNESMTRYQMAKVIALAFDLQTSDSSLPFIDVVVTYEKYVQALLENNITTGTTSSTYSGNEFVKRGQLATFVYRAEGINKVNEKEVPINEEKILEGTISSIDTTTFTVNSVSYNIPNELQHIINSKNSTALEGAIIKGSLKNGVIEAITSLTIVNEGTKENPIILQSEITPVASLFEVNSPKWQPELIIAAPFVKLINFNGDIVRVTAKVQNMELTEANIAKLYIDAGTAATIRGKAKIEEAQVLTENAIVLDLTGEIAILNIPLEKALVTLNSALKIRNLISLTNAPTAVILNYHSIQENIINLNGKVPIVGTPVKETDPVSEAPQTTSPSPGESSSDKNPISTITKSGVINDTSSNSVKINGISYAVASNLAPFFKNSALKNGSVTVTIQNNEVVKVTNLNITHEGIIQATGVTIEGNVTIAADNVKLQGLTVTGNVVLKQQVQTAVDFDNVTIKGSLISEDPLVAKYSSLVASLTPIRTAEAATTRLKITFANSMVGYVEIKKLDTLLSMEGATQITLISLEANGSIFADPSVVLPNLKISQGVTEIELNASIKSVEIDTNTDIKISGKGDFEKVKVKTEKNISLETTGTIKELATDTTNIKLGSTIKIGKTQDLTGTDKPADEMIINYDDVKDNINVEIEENPTDAIAAKIMPVDGRFGYYTLSIVNGHGKKIKYRQVPYLKEGDLALVGSKVPANAKDYYTGDSFIAWFTEDIQVYVVDEHDNILDAYEIDRISTNTNNISKYDIVNGKLIYKTIFASNVNSIGVYFAQEDLFVKHEASELGAWSLDTTGIPTIEITLPENFIYNNSKYSQFGLYITSPNQASFYDRRYLGSYDEQEKTNLYIINQILKNFGYKNTFERAVLSSVLEVIATEETPVYDEDDNVLYMHYTSFAKFDLLDYYVANLQDNSYTTAEEIKKAILKINEQQAENEEKLNIVNQAIDRFYIDKFNKNPYLRIKADNLLQQILDTEELINDLRDGQQKKTLKSQIDEIKRVYMDFQELGTLLTLVNSYNETGEDKEELQSNILNVMHKFAIEVDEDYSYRYLMNSANFNAYLEALLQLDNDTKLTQPMVLNLVKTVNAKEEEMINKDPSISSNKIQSIKISGDQINGYALTIYFTEAIQMTEEFDIQFNGTLAGTDFKKPTSNENILVVDLITPALISEGTITLEGIQTLNGEAIVLKDLSVEIQ